jgi:hypothetical protein
LIATLTCVPTRAQSPKAVRLRSLVATEFRRHTAETDPNKVAALKFNATRALSNYLLLESSERDPQLKAKLAKWQR